MFSYHSNTDSSSPRSLKLKNSSDAAVQFLKQVEVKMSQLFYGSCTSSGIGIGDVGC